ncbi:MAG: hypothetical protein AB8B61_02370 [Cyclobacteriaceae bacterium]
MKKIITIVSVVLFAVAISSCYRQKVCATYVKGELKTEKKTAEKI